MSAGAKAPAASQQAGPYKCWAMAPEGFWIDPVIIDSVEGVWHWLVNPLRAVFDELRVTGMDEEETFISVVGNRLVFPTFREAHVQEEDYRRWWEEWSYHRQKARLAMGKKDGEEGGGEKQREDVPGAVARRSESPAR